MKTDLRFALLPQASQDIVRQLSRVPILLQCKASHRHVHKTYTNPRGELSAQSGPPITVRFERTSWVVKQQTSRVAVALDIGVTEAEGVRAPIGELKLELQTGEAGALYAVARQISQTVSLLPLRGSKLERGCQLVLQTQPAALHAVPVDLTAQMSLAQVAAATLQEMFLQFTVNLLHLREADDPELLHQARIGWRRFKSALQLFKKHAVLPTPPERAPLQPLWRAMTDLRDLEVAQAHTLPMFANAYTGGDGARKQQWQAMDQALANAVARQRTQVLDALEAPAVGTNLIEWTQWLVLQLPVEPPDIAMRPALVGAWLRERMLRLHKQLLQEPANANDPAVQHRIRILSKRLRYCVEALRPLLPKGRAKRWLQLATSLQENIGAVRDIACAVEIVGTLDVEAGIVQFLRGVAFGQRMHTR